LDGDRDAQQKQHCRNQSSHSIMIIDSHLYAPYPSLCLRKKAIVQLGADIDRIDRQRHYLLFVFKPHNRCGKSLPVLFLPVVQVNFDSDRTAISYEVVPNQFQKETVSVDEVLFELISAFGNANVVANLVKMIIPTAVVWISAIVQPITAAQQFRG